MKKSNYYQLIRGICILLVILIHTLYQVDNTYINVANIVIRRIINFATATFFFISGYFTYYKNETNYYLKKIKRVLIPLLIWDVIYTLLYVMTNEINFISGIKVLITSSSGAHLYFIYVLIQLIIISPFLFKLLDKKNNKVLMYFPFLITPLYYIVNTFLQLRFSLTIPLYNYWVFGWISYYYLGLFIKSNHNDSKKIGISLLIILMLLSVLEGMFTFIISNNYNLAISQLTFSNYFYCCVICCYIFYSKREVHDTSILKKIGDYSFGIYLSHVLILKVINKLFSYLHLNYFLNILIIYIICVIIVYIVNSLYYRKVKPLWKK